MNLKEKILSCAVKMARDEGLHKITRDAVADAAGTSGGSVAYYFKDFRRLKAAVIDVALADNILDILGQALLDKHPKVLALPQARRDQIAKFVSRY